MSSSLSLSWIPNRRETDSQPPAALTMRTRGPSSDSEPARNRLPVPRLRGQGWAEAGAQEDSCEFGLALFGGASASSSVLL
eukprot:6454452-Alexandrium_andersonii.AAC.1